MNNLIMPENFILSLKFKYCVTEAEFWQAALKGTSMSLLLQTVTATITTGKCHDLREEA